MASMTTSDAEAVMRSMVECCDRHAVLRVMRMTTTTTRAWPMWKSRGPEGFCRDRPGGRVDTQALTVSVEDLIADGDRVAARIRWRGTSAAGEPISRETIVRVEAAGRPSTGALEWCIVGVLRKVRKRTELPIGSARQRDRIGAGAMRRRISRLR